MNLTDLKLRCFAQQEQNKSWSAICIDLNLIAQEDDLISAHKKLHAMISDYLTEALTDDAQYIGDLIPRKSPLIFVLRYYWLHLSSRLRKAAQPTFGHI